MLVLAGTTVLLILINWLPWQLNWDLWAALTAIGTVGATLAALVLAFRSWVRGKDATARLVSAWVSDEYIPLADGSAYRRKVQLHVANESNEPVFDAMTNVCVGPDGMSLGPLAAPSPISVVPPRRELIFDISIPLLAHADSWYPKAELTFEDSQGRRWLRGLNGEIDDVTRKRQRWSKRPVSNDERQIGRQDSQFNPMLIALTFLAGLRDADTLPDALAILLAPEAPGWGNIDWEQLRKLLDNYQPTSMVEYPAPRIARIRLSGDSSLEGRRVEGVGKPLELNDYMVMTLTLDPLWGWKVFGVGRSVGPDEIFFGGSLSAEIRPHLGAIVPGEDSN